MSEVATLEPARVFPKRFHDRITYTPPSWRDMWRVMRSGGFSGRRQGPEPVHLLARAAGPSPLRAGTRGTTVTWVGHASFVLQVGGLTFLTDPVWSDALPGGVRRTVSPGVAWEALPPVDGVLISHNHYDHLDAPTIRRLPRSTPCFVPANLGPWFRAKGFTHVTEADWWDSIEHRGVKLTFVPAQHWSRRGLLDENRSLWGGWTLRPPDGGTVYFAGDSGSFDGFREIGRRVPGVDVAVLPIGAYEPRWFMKNLHMDPEEAVQAFVELGARRFVPMHWGTFVLTREPLLEPVERLRAEWEKRGLPRDDLWELARGETRTA